jgi:hypothetical protein
MQVVAGAGTTSLTVTRHQKGSTAVSHPSGAFVSDFTTFINQGEIEQFGDLINNFILHYKPEVLGGTSQTAGYAWPSQYGPSYYDVFLWVASRKWEVMNRFWLQNMLDQTYLTINGNPNARAAAMYNRGWYTQLVFNIGPHKAVGGNQLFQNRSSLNPTNWNRYTARWYHEAAVIDPGDRFAQGNLELDWPYYYAFNDSLGSNRPAMYLHIFPHAFEIQNTWGWPLLRQNGASAAVMTLHPLRLNFPFSLRYVDLFTSEAEEGELVSQVASQTAAAVNGTIFSGSHPKRPYGFSGQHLLQRLRGARSGHHESLWRGERYQELNRELGECCVGCIRPRFHNGCRRNVFASGRDSPAPPMQ